MNFNSLMNLISKQFQKLSENGFKFQGSTLFAIIICIVVDLKEKQTQTNVVHTGAYFACANCETEGKLFQKKFIIQLENLPRKEIEEELKEHRKKPKK
jgi:cytochrome c553